MKNYISGIIGQVTFKTGTLKIMCKNHLQAVFTYSKWILWLELDPTLKIACYIYANDMVCIFSFLLLSPCLYHCNCSLMNSICFSNVFIASLNHLFRLSLMWLTIAMALVCCVIFCCCSVLCLLCFVWTFFYHCIFTCLQCFLPYLFVWIFKLLVAQGVLYMHSYSQSGSGILSLYILLQILLPLLICNVTTLKFNLFYLHLKPHQSYPFVSTVRYNIENSRGKGTYLAFAINSIQLGRRILSWEIVLVELAQGHVIGAV